MPRGYRKKILSHPEKLQEWKSHLRNSSMKVGFQISLSRSMLEYLCAVADNVQWDRSMFWNLHAPDNWIAAQNALVRRGLISRRSEEEIKQRITRHHRGEMKDGDFHEWNHYVLTPAGEAVVSLLKMAGLFEEQMASIDKKAKGG